MIQNLSLCKAILLDPNSSRIHAVEIHSNIKISPFGKLRNANKTNWQIVLKQEILKLNINFKLLWLAWVSSEDFLISVIYNSS